MQNFHNYPIHNQYILMMEGKITKDQFLKSIRINKNTRLYGQNLGINEALSYLKSHNYINEAKAKQYIKLKRWDDLKKNDPRYNFEDIAKKPTMLKDVRLNPLDYINPYIFAQGIKYELELNPKLFDEPVYVVKEKVIKNLAKNMDYYINLIEPTQKEWSKRLTSNGYDQGEVRADGFLKKELIKNEKANTSNKIENPNKPEFKDWFYSKKGKSLMESGNGNFFPKDQDDEDNEEDEQKDTLLDNIENILNEHEIEYEVDSDNKDISDPSHIISSEKAMIHTKGSDKCTLHFPEGDYNEDDEDIIDEIKELGYSVEEKTIQVNELEAHIFNIAEKDIVTEIFFKRDESFLLEEKNFKCIKESIENNEMSDLFSQVNDILLKYNVEINHTYNDYEELDDNKLNLLSKDDGVVIINKNYKPLNPNILRDLEDNFDLEEISDSKYEVQDNDAKAFDGIEYIIKPKISEELREDIYSRYFKEEYQKLNEFGSNVEEIELRDEIKELENGDTQIKGIEKAVKELVKVYEVDYVTVARLFLDKIDPETTTTSDIYDIKMEVEDKLSNQSEEGNLYDEELDEEDESINENDDPFKNEIYSEIKNSNETIIEHYKSLLESNDRVESMVRLGLDPQYKTKILGHFNALAKSLGPRASKEDIRMIYEDIKQQIYTDTTPEEDRETTDGDNNKDGGNVSPNAMTEEVEEIIIDNNGLNGMNEKEKFYFKKLKQKFLNRVKDNELKDKFLSHCDNAYTEADYLNATNKTMDHFNKIVGIEQDEETPEDILNYNHYMEEVLEIHRGKMLKENSFFNADESELRDEIKELETKNKIKGIEKAVISLVKAYDLDYNTVAQLFLNKIDLETTTTNDIPNIKMKVEDELSNQSEEGNLYEGNDLTGSPREYADEYQDNDEFNFAPKPKSLYNKKPTKTSIVTVTKHSNIDTDFDEDNFRDTDTPLGSANSAGSLDTKKPYGISSEYVDTDIFPDEDGELPGIYVPKGYEEGDEEFGNYKKLDHDHITSINNSSDINDDNDNAKNGSFMNEEDDNDNSDDNEISDLEKRLSDLKLQKAQKNYQKYNS